MRAYVSVDLEGMPFIASVEHLYTRGPLYSEARKIMTKVTLWVAEALHREGFDEVFIADSHGPMVNIEVENLPDYVYIIRGYPRPTSMVVGIEGANAAIFLGYHAKAGSARATFDHTFAGSVIDYIEINGVAASEFLINAYVAGHFNVPVILVAGDQKLLEDDVARYAPWVERVPLKSSYSRFASISPSLEKIKKDLEEAVKRAVEKFKKGEVKILKASYPVEVKIRFLGTEMADTAELLPIVKRIDGKTIVYKANDIIEAYKILELLILAAARTAQFLRTE
jgi:D-amino peptidase